MTPCALLRCASSLPLKTLHACFILPPLIMGGFPLPNPFLQQSTQPSLSGSEGVVGRGGQGSSAKPTGLVLWEHKSTTVPGLDGKSEGITIYLGGGSCLLSLR